MPSLHQSLTLALKRSLLTPAFGTPEMTKGYTVREIVDAVVRSISPSLPLRSYLEAISEINLPTLRRITRAHYQEKNSSELYAELANLAQSPYEEPQTFLIRALNLREKIIYASKEEHSKLKYDSEHVQSMFLHTIKTGLISSTLRSRIQPLLQDIAKTDEKLMISQLNVAVTEEAEQSKKLVSNVKVKAKVTQVGQAQTKPSEKPQNAQEAEMLTEMRALKAKVAVLEQEVKESQVKQKNPRPNRNSSKGPRFQGNKRGCPSCGSSGFRGSVIFYREGGLWKFFKFCKFLVIPYCMSKIFWPPLMYWRIQVIPPHTHHHHHLLIKAAELVSVFEAEIDHPLGLLKVKARGILIVVRVKLQNSHHINIFYTTNKKFRRQLLFIPSYFPCYGKQVTMATERYFYISAVWRCRRPRFGIEVTVDLKSNFCVWLLG